mgnify:CR=1 FL=1
MGICRKAGVVTDIAQFVGQRVHLVGIGGSSMAGLAQMLHQEGYQVTGSDRSDGYALQHLRDMGIDARAGHFPEWIAGAALLVYSAAISPGDAERQAAAALGIPQMERAVLLGQLMRGYDNTVCVCGTHGKTTVSAMIAQMLLEMGQDPTVHIGGSLDAIGGGSRLGSKALFVAEACEFNRSFLHMPPTLALVTNIEADHLDTYGDMAHLVDAFGQFLDKLPPDGVAIGLKDDERVMSLLSKLDRRAITFGFDKNSDWTLSDITYNDTGCPTFTALHHGRKVCQVALQVGGDFNALHALSALAVADVLGLDVPKAAQALHHYRGARRRFEHTGVINGMMMYHDYGHNPAEMRAALSVAKKHNRRVIAVMQPHTYSRVKTLFDEYLTCTQEADITLVTDIFAAREVDPGDIDSSMLVDGMKAAGIDAHLTRTFDDTEAWLLAHGRPGDLVLTMSCGDIHLLNQQMQEHWDAKQAK